MTSEAPAIVAGHGGFGAGIVSAVEQIAGRAERLVALSNVGLEPRAIESLVRETIALHGSTLIFTDLPAGSFTIAARRIQRERPELVIVTGAGLPTVLSYACGGDVEKAVEQGRDALKVIEVPRDA
jgi:PTS system N-acetylgalactosamine-specific IIA component